MDSFIHLRNYIPPHPTVFIDLFLYLHLFEFSVHSACQEFQKVAHICTPVVLTETLSRYQSREWPPAGVCLDTIMERSHAQLVAMGEVRDRDDRRGR